MGALQRVIARAVAQLRGMSLSQRVAILLGGLLVAASLIGLVQWAASPEMVPLLDQTLEPEEVALVRSGLEAMREKFEVVGQRILVSKSANRPALLAQLQQQNQLPTDTSTGFDALVREANPWISQEENNRRWTVALQREIEHVLKQFKGVKVARVFLNLNARPRGFARNEPAASASVTLIMEGHETVSRPLAQAAARLVAGAVQGLGVRAVQVVDANGASALDWEEDSSDSSFALHRQRRELERQIAEKIRNQFPGDPKLRVNVQVDLDLTSLDEQSSTPTDPVDISQKTTSDHTVRATPSGPPGVQPNVGLTAGGGGTGESTESETTSVERQAGTRTQVKRTPPGAIREVLAALNVSSSYLEGVYRRQNPPNASPPTELQIQALFETEKTRLLNQVTALVKPQTADQVRVDWYYDTLETPGPVRAAGMDGALELLQEYGPQSGLALLALLSLGLMLRMARKSDLSDAFGLELGLPQEAIEAAKQAAHDVEQAASRPEIRTRRRPAARGPTAEEVLLAGTVPVGQAAVTEGLLVAREVDERTVQISKMVDQMSQMVAADPEAVSSLFEQWVQKNE